MKQTYLAVMVGLFGMGACNELNAADVLIEKVTVVSPERDDVLAAQNVLIRDGRIAAIGQHVSADIKARRINGKGKFLTPGLMDSHVHVSMPPGLPFPLPDDATLRQLRADYFLQQPRSYLYHGVTQVLDPSGHPEPQAIFQQQAQKPELFRCGAAPIYNGYPTSFIAPEHRMEVTPEFIFDPKSGAKLPNGVSADYYTPEAVVARIKKTGAICVKVFIEDGFGDAHHLPIPSNEILARVRKAAHDAGMPVLGHANATDMQKIAVDANVDVIAHGTWNWNAAERAAFRQDATQLPASVAGLMGEINEKNIAYQPTLMVLPGLAAMFKDDTLTDSAFSNVVPSGLIKWYGTAEGAWFKNGMIEEDGIDDIPGFLQSYTQVELRASRSLKYLYDLGRPVLLASDTPSSPTYGNQPGLNTYREMQHLADAGIPLRDIFKAGTINNAKQFRIEKDYGTVQVGKVANILLLNANPLLDLSAWNQIDKVIVHGEVIERESLKAK